VALYKAVHGVGPSIEVIVLVNNHFNSKADASLVWLRLCRAA